MIFLNLLHQVPRKHLPQHWNRIKKLNLSIFLKCHNTFSSSSFAYNTCRSSILLQYCGKKSIPKHYAVAYSSLNSLKRFQHSDSNNKDFNTELLSNSPVINDTDFATFYNETGQTSDTTSVPTGSLQTESFADYGLGGWDFPHHWIQSIMEHIHTTWDIGWMPTIAMLTVAVRILALPAYIKMRQFNARSHNHLPEQMRLQMNVNSTNPIERKRKAMEYMEFLSKHQLSPFKPLLYNLPTGLIFISFFAALRGMAEANLPSFVNGGSLWFTNLAIADPYFLLPLLACTTLHLLIRFGAATAEVGPAENIPFMKKILLWSPLVLIPFMIFQPSCMFIFWMTSNSFSFFLMLLFLQPSVQRACNIPKMVQHPPSVKHQMGNMFGSFQKMMKAKNEELLRQQALKKVHRHMDEVEKFSKKKKK